MRSMYEIEESETMSTNGNGSTFAIGLLCGAAVGAALGLLFAPKSGAATRRDVLRSADQLKRRAMEMYDGAADTIGDLSDRSAKAVEQAADMSDRVVDRVKAAASRVSA